MDMFKDVNGKVSAKRVIGGIGLSLTITVALTLLIMSIFPNNNIDPNALGFIASICGFCSGLIGMGTFEKPTGE